MQLKSSLKKKYCPMIDAFIRIREFSPDALEQLFRDAAIHDKFSYQEAVVRQAVPDYEEGVLSRLQEEMVGPVDRESAVEELYRMCIKVNPGLNIYNVTLPVEEGGPLPETRPATDLGARIRSVRGMEEALAKRVVGQAQAVRKVARCIAGAKVGIKDPNRPAGCFLFAGQTGVGKTELAKALAEFLTGDEKEMVRVDCSEFSQPHEYSKLIGAPPGYVGYEDGGSLLEPLLKRPENVVLFDEIEKASPKIHNLLLQAMDEGILTDNKGRRIPFHNAVIVMTSNVGAEGLEAMKRVVGYRRENAAGLEVMERETRKTLEKTFRPEFLNRLDEVICFHPLGRDASRKIVRLHLQRLKVNLSRMGITLSFTPGVVEFLAKRGTDPRYGARPLKRAVKRYLEVPLAEMLFGTAPDRAVKIQARVSGGEILLIEQQGGRSLRRKGRLCSK